MMAIFSMKDGFFAFMLRHLSFFLFALVLLSACRKDKLFTGSNAALEFSTDTIFFDTVFTTVGSLTERVKIYNPYDEPVELTRVWLKNGQGSNFKINVDGLPGKAVKNVRIEARDSIFVFVEVTVDPNGGTTPLVIEDQLLTEINGNVQDVDLVAWGQDAYFFSSTRIFANGEVALFTDKPTVFYGYSLVDTGTTLIIPCGARVHFHANSGLIVGHEASLKILGCEDDPVIIQGDRLEDFFKEVPGQWGQIVFTQTSQENEVRNAIIKNGSIGLSVGFTFNPDETHKPDVVIENTQILNMSYIGLIGIDGRIEATNTVVANCGDHTVAMVLGGEYQFTHCTFANYWSENPRSKAVLLMTNFSEDEDRNVFKRDLNARFENSIIHGNLDSEMELEEVSGAEFNYVFDHMILKLDTEDISNEAQYINILKNPETPTVDGQPASNPIFNSVSDADYSLFEQSQAVNKGKDAGVMNDLKGNPRDAKPDLGAFEFVP